MACLRTCRARRLTVVGAVSALDAFAAVAFRPALDRVEKVGPHGLRAKITAPDPPAEGVHQEESDRSEDQKPSEVIDLLRPQFDKEEIEPAVRKIDQHRLIGRAEAAIPAHKGEKVVEAKASRHQPPFDMAECAGNALRINFLSGHIEWSVIVIEPQIDRDYWLVHRENSQEGSQDEL